VSTAAAGAPASAPSKGMTIFGKKVSADAVVIALASLVGVFILVKSRSGGGGVVQSYVPGGISLPPAMGGGMPVDFGNGMPVTSQLPAAAAPTAIDPLSLPHVNADLFPHSEPTGSPMLVIGSITGPGGQFTGQNVAGGVPVYAFVNGQWVQGYNAQQLPTGTPLATLQSFSQYEVAGTVTESI
jgi:hypothetical protein